MENSTYQTVLGDTWDIISKKVYGDEKLMSLWQTICQNLIIVFFLPG